MRFGILGPVQVIADGAVLAVGGPRDRRVLATLLLHANRVVTVAGIGSAVWDDPPATAREQVLNVAGALRRRLGTGEDGRPRLVRTRP
ncbi:winged helix-turn-helix domain-containing protein [Streptomyces netropsis]|uniref:AfsR/SARP family transcriptional regulator n=1 Tax=Streptomyces netropsis TaxID=55404 RepID=UPI0037A5BC38